MKNETCVDIEEARNLFVGAADISSHGILTPDEVVQALCRTGLSLIAEVERLSEEGTENRWREE